MDPSNLLARFGGTLAEDTPVIADTFSSTGPILSKLLLTLVYYRGALDVMRISVARIWLPTGGCPRRHVARLPHFVNKHCMCVCVCLCHRFFGLCRAGPLTGVLHFGRRRPSLQSASSTASNPAKHGVRIYVGAAGRRSPPS